MDLDDDTPSTSSKCNSAQVQVMLQGDKIIPQTEPSALRSLQRILMEQLNVTSTDSEETKNATSELLKNLESDDKIHDTYAQPQVISNDRKNITLEEEARSAKESILRLKRQVGAAANVLRERHMKNSGLEQLVQDSIVDGEQNDVLCQKMSGRLNELINSIGKANSCLDELSSKLEVIDDRNRALKERSRERTGFQTSLMTGRVNNIQDLIDDMVSIGHGGEGRVFRGRLKTTGQTVVVKSYFMDCEQSSRIEYAMLVLAHNVRGVKKPIGLLNTQSTYYLIVEDDHNSVPLDVIVDKASLSETQIQCIFSQMAHILYDLKKRLIKHRDVKLDNFLLNTKNGRLSIIDFGWAMYSAIDLVSIDEVKRSGETLMGTFDYLPPETDSPPGTIVSYEKATVFALACILIELFFGYQGKVRNIIPKEGIIGLINKLSKSRRISISKGAVSLIDRCSKLNPDDRLSLEGVLLHPWVPSDKLDTVSFRSTTLSSSRKIKSFEL